LLADALDRAEPGQLVAVLSLADGADALVFRTTDALTARRPSTTVEQQVAAGKSGLPYATFLTWPGQLRREPPRRPDPSAPVDPASVAIGQRVAMTFRKIHSAEGVHNYFWKARPVSDTEERD